MLRTLQGMGRPVGIWLKNTLALLKRRAVHSGLLLLFAVGGAVWLHQPRQPATLWPPHALVSDGWLVARVIHHPEYARFTLVKGRVETSVEVVAASVQDSRAPMHRHTVQPAPGASPPEVLLRWLTDDLRRWETAWPDAELVAPHAHTVQSAGPQRPMWPVFLFGLWLLWLGCQTAEMAQWLKVRPDLRWPTAVAAVFGIGGVGVIMGYGPLPDHLINVMHESGDIFKALSGQTEHDGPLPEALRLWLPASNGALSLPRDAAAHLALGVLAVAMFFVAAWQVTRSWLIATALAWAWLTSPAFSLPATSELPTTLVAFLYLGSLPSFASLIAPTSGATRWRPWLGFLSTGILLGLSRPSLVLLPMLAGTMILLERRLGHTRIDRLVCKRLGHVRRAFGNRWYVWAGLVALLLAVAPAFYHQWPDRLRWLLSALNPLDVTTLHAVFAPFAGLGPAIPLLAGVGSVVLVRRAACLHSAWLAVPLSIGIYYKLYSAASCGTYYEILRYGSHVAPLTMGLAAVGAAYIWAHFSRRWQHGFVAAALLVPAVPALSATAWDWHPDSVAWGTPLDRNRQRDARLILSAARRWPSCRLIARVRLDSGLAPTMDNHAYAIVGLPTLGVQYVPATAGLAGALARVDRDSGPAGKPDDCVLLLHTLDCNRIDGPSCLPDEPQTRPVMERTFPSVPYANPMEHGRFTPLIRLAVWKLR